VIYESADARARVLGGGVIRTSAPLSGARREPLRAAV
jgi:hypothetical protein